MLFVALRCIFDYLAEDEGTSCYAFRWFVACV